MSTFVIHGCTVGCASIPLLVLLLVLGCGGASGTKTGPVGTTGAAGGSGTAGTGATVACAFTVSSELSAKIPTVGIVTWSTTLDGVQSARIDFGLAPSYGMTAPVDLSQASNPTLPTPPTLPTLPTLRTLLLGMKTSRLYHFRIAAVSAAGECRSDDYTIMTGPVANGLQKPAVTTSNGAALAGGFLVTGQHATTAGMSSAPAYILDADGDYVWWIAVTNDVSSARMSYDGTHMWINSVNVPSGTARVHRVTMDGLTDEDLSGQFTGQSHQLTVLPDETIAFYAYGANGCDDIKERAPNGTVRTIVNAQVALRTTGDCHVNNIQYSPPDDTLVFSDLNHNQVAKVKRSDGSTVWILNGTTATLTGASSTWVGGQHGLHVVDLTHILVFNNNINGTGGANALEFLLDPVARTAARIWSYAASPAITIQVMGDLQRLPNGNTVIAYSTKGALHEVSPAGAVLQTWLWPGGATFGYIEKRASLYGPPPR
jgi:hypothetical protein